MMTSRSLNRYQIERCKPIQRDLESVKNWFHDNKMILNTDKCNVITFTYKTKHIVMTIL